MTTMKSINEERNVMKAAVIVATVAQAQNVRIS